MQSIINGISQASPVGINQGKGIVSTGETQTNFADTLKSAIASVNESQKASDVKTEALASGNINDLHEVMIASQKASVTLEAAVQIQRKVIDAYNEVMRMQV